ncbi:MAG: SDR family oxidoreductase [Candidatus Eremiobacteraeota bacterium]|nr:SDR family oxidoreductase [Candidatus Eremiobacteraeota bacterium]
MDKIALVTGAGSGIGRACAIGLCEAGFVTVLVGRREAQLKETAAAAAGKTHVAACDVSDESAVDGLFTMVKENFGRLDVLFNNAGAFAPPVPFEDLTKAQWDNVVAVNLTGSFLCARNAFRLMKEQRPMGGRIINNGSVSAHAPRPNSAPYTATKHAITGLTKSLALDGRKYDIACSQIDIGNALTEMTARMKNGVMQANGAMAPEPTMEVTEVAKSVVFMASLPLDANVQFMAVMATKMPWLGRG